MTKRKPPVAVKWSAILPHIKSDTARPMARPFATYGGALFVIGYKTKTGGTLYSVLRFVTKGKTIEPVNAKRTEMLPDEEGKMTQSVYEVPAVFATSTSARQWAAAESAKEVANYGKKTA